MAIQTKLGKAFEFACLQSLYNNLSNSQLVIIEQTNAVYIARDSFNKATTDTQRKMIDGANAATKIIKRLEPQLEHSLTNGPLYLAIQEDSAGIAGDVRDLICLRRENQWEIGLSCKHNHSAVKHSRLSPNIDFGASWFGIPCSENYFNEINSLFEELTDLKNAGVLWRNIPNKEQRFYKPLLVAFMNELKRLDTANPGIIPTRLLHYLLGRNDFYKIITHDNKKVTQVQSFNIYGTLNRSAGRFHSLVNVPQLTMPTRLYDINFRPGSGNTILVVCDNGWTISMRIHNARSLVEPSLKFDVGLTGVPSVLYSQFEPW
ncbi:MAG: HaeIII family restriction endonuclease [Peptococcia bacterium]